MLVRAYNSRSVAYYHKTWYDLAITDLGEAIKLDPNYATAYVNRAFAYKEQGKKAEAIADFEKVLDLSTDPDLVDSANQALSELGA